MTSNSRCGSLWALLRARSLFPTALLLFAAICRAQISSEAGAFYFKQYLPDVYGADPQNWAAVQDLRGVMYFGNTGGVLEYNGSSWRMIGLPDSGYARSLAIDESGTVYVGGRGEIGFLKPDATGTLKYVSLVNRIPSGDRRFGDVWNVYATKDGVLFGSPQRIFRWGPSGMTVWRPPTGTKFGFLFLVNSTPYVQRDGLYRIVDDILEPVPGSGIFPATNEIRGVLPYAGSLIVATSDAIYRSDGNKFTRWATPIDSLLRKVGIHRNTIEELKNGDLAIGTERGGVLLITPEGRLDRIIDRKSGIASNAVHSIYTDRDGSLWLMLSRGIAHEELELPVTRFGEREGLEEIVIAIQRQGNTLYAGTMTGLNRLVLSRDEGAHFEPVPGIQGQMWALLSTSRSLIAGGQHGIYEVFGATSKPILQGALIYDLSPSLHDPNLLYAAGRLGLYVLHFEGGHWRVIRELPSEGQEFRSVQEDNDGRVWVTSTGGILRINLEPQIPAIERFTEGDVPGPIKDIVVYRVGTRIVFATPAGLRQFERESKKFVPCTAFGSMFADGTHAVSMIRESRTGDVWISGEGYNGLLHNRASGAYTWEENPLARAGIGQLWALYLDPDDIVWAAGKDGGLARYSVWSTAAPITPFAAELQSVQLQRDGKTLFGGVGRLNARPRISHAQNALRFQFAAPAFDDESRTQYQVRLDDLDHSWSEWSSETRKEYTNLWEGRYVFHVRARDLYGRISTEDTFAFTVRPPWFRTWWAYLLYVLAFVGAVTGIVKWRLHAITEANRKLEQTIAERTEQIREQRDTIKQDEEKARALLLNILPESVAQELSATGSVTPLGYDVTVCFTDFVGFTVSSEGMPPAELVAALHKYFTAFDEIIDRYGLEKLKTIGDSYMFVSGLPTRSSSHAVDAVLAALEIANLVSTLADSKPGWKVRVGLHSGPVVAGVVGMRKFAFDIWGETVNFASRFESSGYPNRVNISAVTHDLVWDLIDCEARGPIKIKEGRKLDMYFARGIRSELLEGDAEGRLSEFAIQYQKKFGHPPRAIPARASSLLLQPLSGD